jgi:hypothetical protein
MNTLSYVQKTISVSPTPPSSASSSPSVSESSKSLLIASESSVGAEPAVDGGGSDGWLGEGEEDSEEEDDDGPSACGIRCCCVAGGAGGGYRRADGAGRVLFCGGPGGKDNMLWRPPGCGGGGVGLTPLNCGAGKVGIEYDMPGGPFST